MQRRWLAWTLFVLSILLTACQASETLSPKNPVTLTLWHNFGGQMQATMDAQIEAFNNTIGRAKGIIVTITSISSSSSLQNKLIMIATGEPGAPEMPDLTTCYPATAAFLANKGLLAPLDRHFTTKELDSYLEPFLQEGRLFDGKLYVFPIAKSTEVLFLNQTLFDHFAKSTGVSKEALATFEGIASAALEYYHWTDGQTPHIPNDGKAFFAIDSSFNVVQVGMEQLGTSIFAGDRITLDSPEFQRIFATLLEPAVKGGLAIYKGYSTDLAKTGDILCSTGSTAGILFYGNEITYPDNTKEQVEYSVLPYPIWSQGKKTALQRGGGLVVAKSTPKKEEAASIFLKWFTSPEQNMQFVASTGYLPVMKAAFAGHIEDEIQRNSNPNIQKLLRTATEVFANYDFFTAPAFEGFNTLQADFENRFFALLTNRRELYVELIETLDADTAYEVAIKGALEEFREGLF